MRGERGGEAEEDVEEPSGTIRRVDADPDEEDIDGDGGIENSVERKPEMRAHEDVEVNAQ